jgi:hypothetical protein
VTGALSSCFIRRVDLPETAVGVDVGEDFLDLAVLRVNTSTLQHHRIALRGIEDGPLQVLRERLRACCPDAGPRWLALIDSPRWPVDLDCSTSAITWREPIPAGRLLDRALREMLRASPNHAAMRLSMFPTPGLAYFAGRAGRPDCKRHLRAAYVHLFEGPHRAANPGLSSEAIMAGGGNFTRFMLAGFLTFRAFQSLGAQTLEAYPELQFRLAARARLLPKRAGKPALAQRVGINRKLRRMLGIGRSPLPANLDQADAEILALSATLAAHSDSLATLEHPAEGRFLITFASAL